MRFRTGRIKFKEVVKDEIFAWFPVYCFNTQEYAWLERVIRFRQWRDNRVYEGGRVKVEYHAKEKRP